MRATGRKTEQGGLGPLAVDRTPLALRVAQELRQAIISGDIALGTMLAEDRLAERLGVSRTPVREALTALQIEGMIRIRPKRGCEVFLPEPAEVAMLCEFRLLIEAAALRLAAVRAGAALVAALAQANARMRAHIDAGGSIASALADMAFHQAIFDHCGNDDLGRAWAGISGRVGAISGSLHFAGLSVPGRALGEHDRIIAALEAGDVETAVAVLGPHVSVVPGLFVQARDEGRIAPADQPK